MADNIVDGLFGLSPWQVRQQQLAAQQSWGDEAATAAGQSPGQIMARSYANMGTGIGRIAGGMLGMEDPAVAEAKAREAAIRGIDTSNPDAILQRASQVQDPRLKIRLTQYAQQLNAQQQEMALKRAQELAQLNKAQSESSPFAKINPKDYTQESLLKYVQTKNPADLIAIEEKEKKPASYQEWVLAGKPGTYDAWLLRNKKAGAASTSVTIGAEKPIEIPKFREQVQQTIKPYLQTVDAADSSEAMINQAISTGNPNSFQGARVQLAKAFGDSNITAKEIQAAGGDPSIWGNLKDSTSVLFTGTPSIETMNAVKKTVQALRKVAKKKGKSELDIQKDMGINAGLKESDVNRFLSFDQFNEDDYSKPGSLTLPSGKKVTIKVSQ